MHVFISLSNTDSPIKALLPLEGRETSPPPPTPSSRIKKEKIYQRISIFVYICSHSIYCFIIYFFIRMRKSVLLAFATFLTLAVQAQTAEIISLTAEVDGKTRTLGFGSGSIAPNTVSIDWGDGTVVEGKTIMATYDGYNATEITGTPTGGGHIKVYATGPIVFFDCISRIDAAGVTELDVTRAIDLEELNANGNKLTTLDLSKNTKMTKALLNNNALTSVVLQPALTNLNLQNNKLTSFDGAQVPNLKTLYLSNNSISTLDLSHNTSLASIYLLNMGLTSINLGANKTSKLYLSVNNNKLTTLDLTELTGLEQGRLFAMNNELTEVKYTAIGTANLSKNRLTLATIPTENIKTLTYAPQKEMEISDIDKTIDLSAQNNIKGLAATPQTTTYTWMSEEGNQLTAGTDYTEEDGKFTFVKEQATPVYCIMTSQAFPKFTGTNVFRTKAVKVLAATGIRAAHAAAHAAKADVYALDGRLLEKNADVNSLTQGTYIVRQGDKVMKIVVK